MADWSADQLMVLGPRSEVARFARDARPQLLEATKLRRRADRVGSVMRDPKPRDIFALDMMVGETQELLAERMRSLGQGVSQKEYTFQVTREDDRHHFRKVSRRYTSLYFVLAYHANNIGEYGSYLIRNGRSQWYRVPDSIVDSVMTKHGWDENNDDEDSDWLWLEASWELTDHAESRWLNVVYRRLGLRVRRNDSNVLVTY